MASEEKIILKLSASHKLQLPYTPHYAFFLTISFMRYLLSIITLLGIHTAYADTYTVEPKTFKVETALDAIFLPSQSEAVIINPEEWTDFKVTSLVAHGADVKKGSSLIGIDSRALDKEITSVEKSITSEALKLAQAQHELDQLKITTPRSLDTFARNEREAAEDLEHYLTTDQALEIEEAKRSITRAEFYLASQQEELEQLLKMYSEDDKTEETEEIILKRARYYVERAKFSLVRAKANADMALRTTIPRKLETKKRTLENARIANTDARQKLPRDLQIKQQQTDQAARDHQEKKERLAKLKNDRAMMAITAPVDGTVYYGEIKNGKWQSEAAAKALKRGSKLRAHTTLMTVIPTGESLKLYALLGEDKLSGVSKGASGYATTKLNPYKPFPVKVSNAASHPSPKNTFLTTLEPALPSGIAIVPGMKASVKILSHIMDDALKVPVEYLSEANDGSHTVQVKLADGKTATRTVSIGASNDKWAVITKGLDASQVIVK